MQAIKALYDGVTFTPVQPIPVKGKCEVIITFLEPAETEIYSLGRLTGQAEESIDYIEKLCGSLSDFPEMSVDRFLARMRKDMELEL